jgi:biopolymer transport protein ExbD
MSWKLRHEGSPESVEVESLEQVLEGMRDGLWEPTDEVMGPGQTAWMPIENHPDLAETALDYEPMPRHRHEEPTSLDMTALIDVTLVLLIFFVICKAYSEFQARLDTPDAPSRKEEIIRNPKAEEIERSIQVSVEMDNGKPVIKVFGKVTDPAQLQGTLDSHVRQGKRFVMLLADPKVPFGMTAAVQDAARGAQVEKVMRVLPEK